MISDYASHHGWRLRDDSTEFETHLQLHSPKALGIQDSWRHLSLPWLAQCKPSGPAQACTGQDRARIDGVRSRVYLAPNCMLYITIHQSVNQSRPHSLSSLVTSAMECSMTGVRVQTRTVFVVTPGPISAPFIFRSGCMAFRWRGEGRTFLRSTSMINNLCFWFDGSGPPAKKALRAAPPKSSCLLRKIQITQIHAR